jgi:hypothetical protein
MPDKPWGHAFAKGKKEEAFADCPGHNGGEYVRWVNVLASQFTCKKPLFGVRQLYS